MSIEVPSEIVGLLVILAVLGPSLGLLRLVFKSRHRTYNEEWSRNLAVRLPHPEDDEDDEEEEDEDPEAEEIRSVLAEHGVYLNPHTEDEIFYDYDEDEWMVWFDCDGPYGLGFLMIPEAGTWNAYVEYAGEQLLVPYAEIIRIRDEATVLAEGLKTRLQR